MSAFHEVMKSAIIFHVNLKGRIASWEAKCSMFSTRNKKDLNIFSPLRSDRVNGGQAITHGKELSSCTLAGGRASWQRGHSQPDSQKTERDQTERKELSLQSGAAMAAAASRREEQNCRPSEEGGKEGRKGVRLEERLSLPPFDFDSARSPRS